MHVVDSLEVGGLERVVTDLAIEQHRRGHAVCVFSINDTDGFAPDLRAAGIEVVIGGKRGSFDLQVIKRLRLLARERALDVVHAHNFVPNYYAATALLGLGDSPILVGTCHDMGQRLARRQLRFMYRCSLLQTSRLAMVGRQVHERFVGSGIVSERLAETVLNGIPVRRFAATPSGRASARAALGVAPDALVIGAVGRLVDLKNHRLLIEVMATLAPRFPDARLVLIGTGPLDAALREQAVSAGVADRVVFAGQRSEVAQLVQAFDVFAMPSLTEGLSIALLEACATGLAIAATAVGGNVEIVRDGETGLLVPPGDAAALADALSRLLADPPLRARLGDGARRWVSDHASVEAMADTYAGFYERAARAA